MNNRTSRFIPLIVAVSLVVGIVIGVFYANHSSGNRLSIINSSSNKINDLLHIIDDEYVDTVNMSDLVEKALPKILSELDPHSLYIPAKEAQKENDDLKGSFSGIGVVYTVRDDTIHVQNVIKGGPSDKIGLMPGDKIVAVDGKPFVGKECTVESAPQKLKGPKGSKVRVGVVRKGVNKVLTFTITRGDIAVKSIDAAYMIAPGIGYIKLNSFSETTYQEMLVALAKLNVQNCRNLIIDLRGNGGGVMDAAVRLANEFLPNNRLIVYMQGRKCPRKEFRSDGHGAYQQIPLVVLTDELSASSSEIFAGAMQDNDRATIIGRRSFGKGLVQLPIQFRDGSEVRLTIARYYTPSGRCIQKPYVKGDEDDYEMDLLNRYSHGEFYSRDSIKLNGPKYKTTLGRVVYGGGGIMPDIFVPKDTTGITPYFQAAYNMGLLIRFTYDYTDNHRPALSKIEKPLLMVDYLKEQNVINQFAAYASTQGLKRRNRIIIKSKKLFEQELYGRILYNMYDMEAWVEYLNQTDPTVLKAIQVLEAGKAFPTAPKAVKAK